MPKEFYTERDIEDLFKRGVLSLNMNDNIVLTELAYEKAKRLGMKLVYGQPDTPPSAPVRPYVSQPATPAAPMPSPQASSVPAQKSDDDLKARIRSAVLAKMGNQVDPALLDVIIDRVLKSTGIK
jgi:hypothetical protein